MDQFDLAKVEEVVRRLGQALRDDEDPQDLYPLATQFADFCTAANDRLAKCVAILKQGPGKEYEALALATRKPDILELAAALSDSDLADWRDYAKRNRLPVPDSINERAKQELDPLYSRADSFNEKLLREYAAAQIRRDFEGALKIIRHASNLNPGNQSHSKQVATLEKSLRRKELDLLTVAVNQGNRPEIIRLLDRIEDISPGYRGEDAVWDRAMETLAEARREEATKVCRQLLSQAETAYEAEDLESALRLTGEISALVDEHRVDLGTSFSLIDEISEWCRKKLQELRLQDQFDRALRTLEETVNSISKKEFQATACKLPELQEDKRRLEKAWKDVALFRKEVPPDIRNAAEKSNGDLSRLIEQKEKNRARSFVIGISLAVVLTAASTTYVFFRTKAGNQAEHLAALVESQQVLALEEELTRMDVDPPLTLKFPVFSNEMARSKTWLRQQKEKAELAEESIVSLEKAVAHLKTLKTTSGEQLDSARAQAFDEQLARARETSDAVPQDLRAKLENRISTAANEWGEIVAYWQKIHSDLFRDRLQTVEKRTQTELDYGKKTSETAKSLTEIQSEIGNLEQMATPQFAKLAPSGSYVNRFNLLKTRVEDFLREQKSFADTMVAAIEANTVEEYMVAIGSAGESSFMRGDNFRALQKLRSKVRSPEDFLRAVLMPDDADIIRWRQFVKDPKPNRGFPADLSPSEQALFLELRDDGNLRDIYRYTYEDTNNPERLPLYVRTSILEKNESRIGPTNRVTLSGREVYQPWRNWTIASFAPASFEAVITTGQGQSGSIPEDGKISPESEFFINLALNRYASDDLNNYRDSLWKVVDQLIDSSEVNPLFRAFIHSHLRLIMNLRPDDWGMPWSSFNEDFQRLTEIMETPLRSSDWMVPVSNKNLSEKVAKFYQSLKGKSYFAQVTVLSKFYARIARNGFQYAGFIDFLGERKSTGDDAQGNELWGFDTEFSPVVLFRRENKDTPWTPTGIQNAALTPLFITKTDGETLLSEACESGPKGVKPDLTWIRERIPPVLLKSP